MKRLSTVTLSHYNGKLNESFQWLFFGGQYITILNSGYVSTGNDNVDPNGPPTKTNIPYELYSDECHANAKKFFIHCKRIFFHLHLYSFVCREPSFCNNSQAHGFSVSALLQYPCWFWHSIMQMKAAINDWITGQRIFDQSK